MSDPIVPPIDPLAGVDPATRDAAVALLRRELAPVLPELRRLIAERGPDWSNLEHFGLGVGVRNVLRSNGFDEERLGVWNLDDFWAPLAELAANEDGNA